MKTQIANWKAEIEELQRKIKEAKMVGKVRPDYGDYYYCIDSDGDIRKIRNIENRLGLDIIANGRYSMTREGAERIVAIDKANQLLREHGGGDWVIDEANWVVSYMPENNEFVPLRRQDYYLAGQVYFRSQREVLDAIQAIGSGLDGLRL